MKQDSTWEEPNARANLALWKNYFFKACSVKGDSPFEEFTEFSVQKKHVSNNQVQSVWTLLFRRRVSLQIFKAAVLECPGRAQWLFQVCFLFYTPGTFQMRYVIYTVVDFLSKAVDCFYFILLPTLDYMDCGTIVYKFYSCKEFCQLENLSWSSNYPRAVKHL